MTLLYLAITIKLAPELRIFIFYMMELLSSPETWVALLTLTILEIVLGIDNIVFISIISDKLPKEKQKRARKTGLALALITRILLLLSLSWVMSLTDPLFNVLSNDISGRDLILLIGGLFLIYKATTEIHEKIEGHEEVTHKTKGNISFSAVIFQILLLDIIFSLDSVITAVGMANHIEIMIAAVIISVGIMLLAAESISKFVNDHPTVKMLALSFLVLIGVSLLAEGLDQHIPKGYVYFAMAFSVLVEMLNLREKKKK